MCEFCLKHGEGKKWYKVMQHYSDELLAQKGRQAYVEQFISSIRYNANKNFARLDWTRNKLPLAHRFIRKMATVGMKQFHFGQVVPLEDAKKIIDMVQTITRIPLTRALYNSRP